MPVLEDFEITGLAAEGNALGRHGDMVASSVFISDTLSAPSASTALAISAMEVTLGDSLTIR